MDEVCLPLEQERAHLHNAAEHLVQSNRDLREFMQSDPDPEYKAALEENIVVIARYRARIAAIDEELRQIKGIAGVAGLHSQVNLPSSNGSGNGAPSAVDTTVQQQGTNSTEDGGMWL